MRSREPITVDIIFIHKSQTVLVPCTPKSKGGQDNPVRGIEVGGGQDSHLDLSMTLGIEWC